VAEIFWLSYCEQDIAFKFLKFDLIYVFTCNASYAHAV